MVLYDAIRPIFQSGLMFEMSVKEHQHIDVWLKKLDPCRHVIMRMHDNYTNKDIFDVFVGWQTDEIDLDETPMLEEVRDFFGGCPVGEIDYNGSSISVNGGDLKSVIEWTLNRREFIEHTTRQKLDRWSGITYPVVDKVFVCK